MSLYSFSEGELDERLENGESVGGGGAAQQQQHEEEERLKRNWSKKRRRSSEHKSCLGDSLGLRDQSKFCSLMAKTGERSILFSESVIKVNRKGKPQERWLMITDGALYNIEPTSVKVRRRIALSNISHISTSQLSDNFFIIHVPSEYDYLFVSAHKTEIVLLLVRVYREATGEELQLVMQNVIDYRIDKDQQRRISFEEARDGVYTKIYRYAKKSR